MSNERFTCFQRFDVDNKLGNMWVLIDNELECSYEINEIDKPITDFVEELNRLVIQNRELTDYWLLNHKWVREELEKEGGRFDV